MTITEQLQTYSAHYQTQHHPLAFTAQELAQVEHVQGMNVAKPVLVIADGQYYLCVLPACCLIDFDALKGVLGAQSVILADELDIARWFPDCQIGAEPPFGSFYGLPTIMDDRLEKDEYLIFQSGSHRDAIRMPIEEYLRIESPRIASFSYHV